jgi:hypothetical protein
VSWHLWNEEDPAFLPPVKRRKRKAKAKPRTYETLLGDRVGARASVRPPLKSGPQYLDRLGYQEKEWHDSPRSIRRAERWLLKYREQNQAERDVNYGDWLKKAERWICELLERGASVPEVWWDIWCTFEVAYENHRVQIGNLAFCQTLFLFRDAMDRIRFDLAQEQLEAKRRERARKHTPLAKRVLRVPCPACKVPAGELCRGSVKPHVKSPHVDRIDAAKRAKWVNP